ncbi:hypothetical protein BKA61DRAFT_609740 [Leptodontidium sp. MPI-SDFR-AT-0119]|nr:hypothetical protein BKA61DRAFT_609740 [Leptodontidium sp. MPI-SDFR-AT-0119]
MDDGDLRSLCIEKESYYTLDQQQEALIYPGRPQRIFRDRDTYVHIVIPVLTHWVAVQVTISPFALQQYPGQTFFSSKFRYGPCCCQINQSHASIVANTVQKVIDFFYQSFSWNYSSAECCILDPPTNTDVEQCIPVAISRFQAYAGSTSLAQDHSSTIKSLAQDPSTVALSITRLSTNTDILPSQDYPVNIGNAPNGTGCLARDALQPSPPSKKRKRRQLPPPSDEQLVKDTAAWLQDGIKKLSTKNSPEFVHPSGEDFPYGEANACAMYLWNWAGSVENSTAAIVWPTRYISACLLLVGSAFTSPVTPEMDKHRDTIHNWRVFAEIVNSIINEMLLSWNVKAYLLYNIFAAKGSRLNLIARQSKLRRKAFIFGVVTALKEVSPPSNVESLFNPTIILGRMLPQRRYDLPII